jgi:ATPase subunit of ABC transporter with duplicated ATPase domains
MARVTFSKPHLLLLDEPSNHLDMDAVEALVEVGLYISCVLVSSFFFDLVVAVEALVGLSRC